MGSIAEQTTSGKEISRLAGKHGEATEFLEVVLGIIEEAKGEDILSLSLEGKSSLGDYMVIASGRSTRHVAAIAEQVVTRLKEKGFGNSRVEGMKSADWVLIDAGEIIVHLFRPEVREFYNLEKIWLHDGSEDGHDGVVS